MKREMEEARLLAHEWEHKTEKDPTVYKLTVTDKTYYEFDGRTFDTSGFAPEFNHQFTLDIQVAEDDCITETFFCVKDPAVSWWASKTREFYSLAIPVSKEYRRYADAIKTDDKGQEYIESHIYNVEWYLQDNFELTPYKASRSDATFRIYNFDKTEI